MDRSNLCPSCFESTGAADPCPQCGYTAGAERANLLYLKPGTRLAGKYMIGRVLGQGGFGITYLGWDTNLDVKLAIKEFFPQGLVSRVPGQSKVISYTGETNNQFVFGLDRFLREAKILARFEDHPNIVTVRDFFKANGTAYMIMSYVEGPTLEKYLAHQKGRIPFSKTLDIMMPVMDALREVHETGIMHRDISPDNILINRKGRVILIDFGAARQEIREKSKSLSVILKAGYAPEEQYRSRGKQGPWTDIYAVGATLYRCLTGQVPPEAMDRLAEDDLVPPSQLGVEIESQKEAALLKALALRAADRYQAVEEFQSELVTPPATSRAREVYSGSRPKEPAKKPEPALQPEEKDRIIAPSNIERAAVSHDAGYYIDYKGGNIALGDLPIGARVVDPSWQWEFRTGRSYMRDTVDETKPITWIVVAYDHYDLNERHVTLLSEELIGRFVFDDSTSRGSQCGSNHWGNSGTANATCGLRPWLNSTGIHSGEGLYRVFSTGLKGAILATIVTNKECKNGKEYTTVDLVFAPSSTELGDTDHKYTYRIGSAYPYFSGAGDAKRIALLRGNAQWYWTRSPASDLDDFVRLVSGAGEFIGSFDLVSKVNLGVRPALNLKSGTLVSEIRN